MTILLKNLVNSMPRRLQDIIRMEGIPPCTGKRPFHIMGSFQGQNYINKE
jgi:hypothetical protein